MVCEPTGGGVVVDATGVVVGGRLGFAALDDFGAAAGDVATGATYVDRVTVGDGGGLGVLARAVGFGAGLDTTSPHPVFGYVSIAQINPPLSRSVCCLVSTCSPLGW